MTILSLPAFYVILLYIENTRNIRHHYFHCHSLTQTINRVLNSPFIALLTLIFPHLLNSKLTQYSYHSIYYSLRLRSLYRLIHNSSTHTFLIPHSLNHPQSHMSSLQSSVNTEQKIRKQITSICGHRMLLRQIQCVKHLEIRRILDI